MNDYLKMSVNSKKSTKLIKNIYYINDYKNDPLVEYFLQISNIEQIVQI